MNALYVFVPRYGVVVYPIGKPACFGDAPMPADARGVVALPLLARFAAPYALRGKDALLSPLKFAANFFLSVFAGAGMSLIAFAPTGLLPSVPVVSVL